MADLRIDYQLPDEVRARLGALASEFERILAAREANSDPDRAGLSRAY